MHLRIVVVIYVCVHISAGSRCGHMLNPKRGAYTGGCIHECTALDTSCTYLGVCIGMGVVDYMVGRAAYIDIVAGICL